MSLLIDWVIFFPIGLNDSTVDECGECEHNEHRLKPRHDITGQRFGSLVAVRPVRIGKNRELLWECKCDCGAKKTTRLNALLRGATKSCGCLFKKWTKSGKANRKHGLSGTPEYTALCDAIRRCEPDSKDRADYFERGITVCERWRNLAEGIEDFVNHIGKRPSSNHSLDRIDNNRGYEHGNVRWATRKTQLENRRKILGLEQFSTEELVQELQRRGLDSIGGLAGDSVRPRSGLLTTPALGSEATNV